MKRRLPPKKTPGGIFNLKAFKFIPYTTYLLAVCLCFAGIFNGKCPLTHNRLDHLDCIKPVIIYIDVSASAVGISPSLSVYFLSIVNGVAATGRVSMGILADKYGCLTVMIPSTIIAGISTYAWPFAKSLPSLIIIAIIYGYDLSIYLMLYLIRHLSDSVLGPFSVWRRYL